MTAVKAPGRLGNPNAIEPLEEILNDPEEKVRNVTGKTIEQRTADHGREKKEYRFGLDDEFWESEFNRQQMTNNPQPISDI